MGTAGGQAEDVAERPTQQRAAEDVAAGEDLAAEARCASMLGRGEPA